MIIFDQLRISDNGSRMYINLHVNLSDYFDNIILDSVTVTMADKVLETDPATPSEDYIYKKVYTENTRIDNIVIDRGVLDEAFNNWNGESVINPSKPHAKLAYNKTSFSNGLFFIYVKCKGTPSECTPCRLDEEVTLGVTFDEAMLYQKVMGFTKDLVDDCVIPVGFTDFILLWNAFKASVETEHYVPAIKYWSMLFNTSNAFNYPLTKPCGCHGRNTV